ncbi:bifunctional serine/threonine-protein kinase/ABC transporter substrate-binding protein [Streptomyces phaeochromogenes]|uniref:bifunctional serine/threonine-protein kinase/ABC transporter substrate-binding protein n=1 Tax=Streptomyces phaeochromogenes TaxID=1923 RepID=UPI002DD99F09|nr:bifunctional serine/threonine-protein kinase/ABC transporter substrate-binding protein [Streptomyces phaeochromogenes]WRZ32017.1 bifunctional serine/threonine-protein kinase/ABC transporter substrate-binding protein [Streptomyces phaeochromogenes]WSJ05652.1 bifunctional serine/threonine-protein kinase/ABC transporter substrate-binding protein [Streptomyces phaeochromogenes]
MSERLLPTDPASIGGHRLLARLGAGGMGVVYLGRTEAGALAAVKVIQAEYAHEPDFRARFRREVETARRVTSPWAVPVIGADPDADEPWLATAFVPGPSLEEAVARHGPLPTRSVRVLGRMLAAALREVHAAGLVHRDVKPANVLLAVDGPRLIDFGIARATDETAITSADMVVGTPGFLSPEQAEARGAAVGPASDIFSLGCLLAYAASGRPPFGTGTADALLYRTVHDEPDLSGIEALEDTEGTESTGGVELLTLLHLCLTKDPADRPTAEQFGTVLLVEDAVPDGGQIDWLPEDVVRIIADRSAEMLALPDIEPTVADAPAEAPRDGVGDADSEKVSSGRRRLLLASGAAVLLAAGGTAAWAALRDEDDPGASASGARRWAIGVQADLSGAQKTTGQAQERGARLAVEQFNARRKKPFEITLKTADDGGSAGRAPAAAKKLIQDTDVLAVLGPTNDEAAHAVLGTYDEALLPLLSVSAGELVLTSEEYRSFLQCRPSDAAVALPISVYLMKQKETRRAGLLQDRTGSTYAQETATITAWMLRNMNRPVYPRVVPAGTEDTEPVIADMLRAGIGSFVYAGNAPGAARVAKQLAAAGFHRPRIASQRVIDPAFLEGAGNAAEGWVLCASFVDPAAVPAAAAFTAAFRKRFGAAPGYYAAEAYDTVNLVLQELVKATKGERPPGRKELVGLLRKSRYKGITKQFSFRPADGQFTGWGVFLHQVEGGRFRFVGEAPSKV